MGLSSSPLLQRVRVALATPLNLDRLPRVKVDPARLTMPIMLMMWAGLLGLKAWMITRSGFHWDEFWYLTQIHAGIRGELSNGFQMMHILFFGWLPGMGDEIMQLRVARLIMWVLLVISTGLLFLLARRWCGIYPAMLAPIAYLSMRPVLSHGTAFRADSMLLPLSLATLLALSAPSQSRRALLLAGGLWGLAVAISIKAIFLAPVAAGVLCATSMAGGRPLALRPLLLRIGVVGLGAAGVLIVMIAAQSVLMEFSSNTPQQAMGAIGGAGEKVFSSWWPRSSEAIALIKADRVVWFLMGLGLIVSVVQRSPLSALCLSLLPIVFYRNAYQYYYLVMLAPATILISILAQALVSSHASDSSLSSTKDGALPRKAHWVLLALLFGIYLHQDDNISTAVRLKQQEGQVKVLSAVHQIFPKPVAYIDHSGVVASFPKANGFLSSWAMENYKAAGKPFMPGLIEGARPPLLLLDRGILDPKGYRHKQLFPVDVHLLASSYIPYWGPVWVAGAVVPSSGKLHLPFPGDYRLRGASVSIAGRRMRSGDVLVVDHEMVRSGIEVDALDAHQSSSFVWAAARPAPKEDPPRQFFFVWS